MSRALGLFDFFFQDCLTAKIGLLVVKFQTVTMTVLIVIIIIINYTDCAYVTWSVHIICSTDSKWALSFARPAWFCRLLNILCLHSTAKHTPLQCVPSTTHTQQCRYTTKRIKTKKKSNISFVSEGRQYVCERAIPYQFLVIFGFESRQTRERVQNKFKCEWVSCCAICWL